MIGANIHSLHHNEEYFPDSFEYYRPGRWLDEQSLYALGVMGDALMPFSIDPRGCAAKKMTCAETGLVVAKT